MSPLALALAVALKVLVLPAGGDDASGFVEALRIQFAGVASVEKGPPVEGQSAAERIAFASDLVVERDATLAVFVERGGEDGYVMYVVGRQSGRAIVEVFTLPPAARGPEADRALALKARDVLDVLLAPPEEQPPMSAWVEEEKPVRRPALARRGGLWIEAGPLLAVGAAGAQAGLSLGLGVRWRGHEPFAVARLFTAISDETAAGAVDAEERDLGIGVRTTLGRAGKLRFGAGVLAGLRFMSATGRTPAGAEGTEDLVLAHLSLGADARWSFRPRLQLRAGLDLEVGTRRQRFAVNDVPVQDLGQARVLASVGLIFDLM